MANAFNIDKGGSTTSDTHLLNETFHVFSKSPGSPTTTLGGARLKSGHTTTASDVWADEIPAFFNAATQAKFDLFGTKAVKDDLCLFNGNVYKHNGTEFVSLGTEAEVLVDGAKFSKNGKEVVKFHKGRTAINLTADNNNGDGSNNYTAKIYNAAADSTTFVPQFISAMDKVVDGIPSLAYDAAVFAGGSQLAEGLTADNDYICNAYAGVIQFNKARSSGVTVNAWEYIGDKLNTTISELTAAVFGEGGSGDDDASLTQRVAQNTAAIAKLNGTDEGSVAKAVADAEGRVKVTTDNLTSRLEQLEGIQHFSVVVVPEGQTMEDVTPVENTIYLVSDANAADGSYLEYIAFKQGESVVTEKIGSTKIDLSGYTTDAEHEALADRVTALDAATTGRVAVVEDKVSTLIDETIPAIQQSVVDGIAEAKSHAESKASAAESAAKAEAASNLATARTEITAEIGVAQKAAEDTAADELAKALEQVGKDIETAKQNAIDSAKVTLTQGTGIAIPNSGTPQTSFTVSVDTDVIATKASVDTLTTTVSDNKSELEGKITDAQTELQGNINGIDTRLTAAEGKVTTLEGQVAALTTGDTSVAKQIENAIAEEIKDGGVIDTRIDTVITTSLTDTTTEGAIGTAIADAKKAGTDAMAEAQKKVASVTGPTTGLVTVTGEKDVVIEVSDTIATKSDITTEIAKLTAEDGSITTLEGKVFDIEESLAEGGKTAEAIKNAQETANKAVEDAAAAVTGASEALATAKEQSLAQTGTLADMFTVTTTGTVGTGIESITITDSGLAQAIANAQTAGTTAASNAQAAVEGKSLASTSTGSTLVTVTTAGTVGTGMTTTVDTSALSTALAEATAATTTLGSTVVDSTSTTAEGNVTVTLSGTVAAPTVTVTQSDIASASALATLTQTVNTHIAEAAGLYLSVEKVDALPEGDDRKTNKIYLLPLDTEAGREQNIHTEYIWTGTSWEIIGTTAIDISSLEKAADDAQKAADAAQDEVDALEVVVATLSTTVTDNKSTAAAAIATTNAAVATLEGKVTALEGQVSTLEDQVAALTTGDTSVAKQIEAVQSDIDGVSDRVTELEETTVPAALKAAEDAQADATQALTDAAAAKTAADDAQTDATQALADAATAQTTAESKIAAVEVATDATTHFGAQHITATTGDDKKVTITVTRADEWSVGETKPAKDVSSVINGKMSDGKTIDDANLVDGTSMFAGNTALTTFVGDLGKLTTGTSMFSGCTGLVDFCADLSSLVDGTDMFKGCALSEESIIYIVDSLPKVTSGTICLGTTVPEDLKDEAEKIKGWTVVVA
jgi:predicted  nucleic acid-binding Zn-ribbon protein